MSLAPIVLFVYNRPWHTIHTLRALKNNVLADQSTLYIFSDGPKTDASEEAIHEINLVRSLLKEEQWCLQVNIIERESNMGLAENIIQGVTEIINKFGSIIVLEDDLVTSTGFLKYMNDALNFYENSAQVMHISGYMYPHTQKLPETFFYNVPLCWGWATWKDRWQNFNNDACDLWLQLKNKGLIDEVNKFGGDYLSSQLAYNVAGSLKTWFIKWHTSVFLQNGFTLYPMRSLVDNIGFDNTGVHNTFRFEFSHQSLAESIQIKSINITENKQAQQIVKHFYKNLYVPKSKKKPKLTVSDISLRKLARKVFLKLFPDLGMRPKPAKIFNLYRTYSGNNCKIYPPSNISNAIIGNYTYISKNAQISNIIIGKFCSIGPNVIFGWGIHPTHGLSTHPMFYSTKAQNGMTLSKKNKIEERSSIIIGNDVMIGMNVIILDGITIADGAIIGAGALVSKDIPAYAIAVGNPIKIIKYRFDKETIEKMLQIKWWDNEENLELIEQNFFEVEKYMTILNN